MAMTQQAQFSPALLEVMDSANKINPVTPDGQQTVAARVMAQVGKPVQGLPGVLAQTQQAAPMVAEKMETDRLNQAMQQAQPKPPAMMAEGGIASLPMGDDDYEYADGGIIGYAGPDGSEVNAPTAFEDFIEYLKSKGIRNIPSQRRAYAPEEKPTEPPVAAPKGPQDSMASLIANAPASYGFSPEGIAAALQQQRPPAPRPAPSQREGIAQVMPAAADASMPTFTGAAEEAMGVFKRPDDTRLRAEGERLRELQTQRPTSAAEIRANEIAREKQRAQYEEISGRDTGLGELMSVLGGISRRTGALEGLEGYRTKRDTAAAKETEAARLFAQQQSLLEQKDYANKVGDVKASMEIEQALIKNQEEYNKAMIPASTSAYSTKAQQVSSAADRAARAKEAAENRASAERVARIQSEVRATGKSPYDVINDNIQKQQENWVKANIAATPEEQQTAFAQIKKTAYDDARRFGLNVPELPSSAGAAPGAQLRYNPQTGKIE
tara:strand:+ start:20216 stop:21703 length:1488 start_codon:yes stop_codon:yes gene_type:complete